MPELTTIPTAELAELKDRLTRLAREKAQLQLVALLMNRLGELPGLEKTVEGMLQFVMDILGGLNVTVFYRLEDAIHSVDVHGKRAVIVEIQDDLVRQVFETHEFVSRERDFDQTGMTTKEFTKASTWVMPLLVGPELVGVLRMDDLLVSGRELRDEMQTFLRYASLVLKNEISGETRLRRAFDEVRRANRELKIEVAQRKRADEDLQQAMDDLERQIATRTAELRGIIEGTNSPIFSVDWEHRYVAFNQSHVAVMRTLYGAEIEVGRSILDYLTVSSDRQTAKRNLDRALSGEHFVESTYYGEEKRTRRLFEISHHPVRADDGHVIGVAVFVSDVTERAQSERELRESEEKFAAAFRASPSLIAITRAADGTILDVNEGYTRLLGYSRAESVGKTTAELSIWADPADRAAFIAGLAASGEVHDLETTLRRKDGTLVTVLDSARAIQLQGTACTLSVAHDITERKRAEIELARLNRALRVLSDTNEALIRATDEATLLNEVCRLAVDVGSSRMAWVCFAEHDEAKTLRPVAHAGLDSEYVESAKLTWADDERGRGPGGTSVRSGQPCIFRSLQTDPAFAPWRDAAVQRGYKSIISLPLISEGETLGALLIYAGEEDAFDSREVEILEELAGDLAFGLTALRTRAKRDQALEALHKREADLSESQRLAHIGSWDWDATTDTIWWSDEYYRIYGLDPGQPTPNYLDHLLAYTGESARMLDAAVKRAMEAGEPYEVDLELARPAASTRWIVARGEAKRDAQGRIWGLRGTAQDITERKQLEEERRRLNIELEARVGERTAELARAVQELESFSYSVSHDLRAPLRAIDGFSNLLERRIEDGLDEEGRRLLQVIRKNAHQMGRLIDDLLRFSRTNRAELRKVTIDMKGLAEEILDGMLPAAERARTEVRLASLPAAHGDVGLVRVVLQNLISNALKYSAPQGQPCIEIGFRPGADGPEYFVRDNGVGFDPRYADKLFGVFQRLHSPKEFEGTGIGLALVKRIVNRHGGRVWAEGEVDRGATFWFTLGGTVTPSS